MKSGSDGRKTDAAAYREKAEQESRRDAADQIGDDAIVSQEAGREFSEHLNKGRKIIVQSNCAMDLRERMDGIYLADQNGEMRLWRQPFVVLREVTRAEYDAERLNPTTASQAPHFPRARYYEVMAD